ncbi:hypothetical protein [Mycolicibacterium celeriflavum]|uniref:Uncharacterized protein n=1 Tax=Mycolicibacterium celeriflavum TaxID=1249101 RepID=A0A1X0BKM1_MYCCF|nr:hypothetical protein [Mycolicibacterium celeriflavum]MCV7236553.1 hypothetical protein [Mycolicibacterium celeriflavum]ORA43052.1 hypothetical protein BST21_22505 [Mycolicibacterium celeriflavum]BBY41804.1 hypothetical protein MCEL_00990 [Mycolicibacterium celeriflavum]
MTTNKKRLEFLRTKDGVKLMGWTFSLHVSYDEILRLNEFVASGERATTPKLENQWDRSTLRRAPQRELEMELDRRQRLHADRATRGLPSDLLERELEKRGRLEPEDAEA